MRKIPLNYHHVSYIVRISDIFAFLILFWFVCFLSKVYNINNINKSFIFIRMNSQWYFFGNSFAGVYIFFGNSFAGVHITSVVVKGVVLKFYLNSLHQVIGQLYRIIQWVKTFCLNILIVNSDVYVLYLDFIPRVVCIYKTEY